ncbi:Bifunctional RNase H/acid phosphatase OS=Streptomyces tendae OX=1932 GN=GUR47_10965 PE=4 SV=1 [Streptomyces tendae]
MKPLAAEAARVFPPGRVTYEWIPRADNKHADRLANEAMDAGARGEQWSPSTSTAELATGGATGRTAGARGSGDRPAAASAGAAEGTDAESTTGVESAVPGAETRGVAAPRAGGVRGIGAESTVAPAGTGGGGGGDAAPAGGGAAVGERLAQAARTGAADASADADVRAAKAVASPGWGPPDMGAPATFVLLRHGETPLTPQKRFSGSGGSDPSLSPVGREQAEKVAESLARRGTIEAIVASPLARTRETAGIVAARLGLEVTVEEGLRETDFGAWEGLTFGEVRERHPADLDAWLASPDAEPTGGGESFAATGARIAATRDKLVAAYAGRTVLLVSHVTPIKTFLRLALGAPPESLFRMELSAASLSAVAYYADGGASVRLFNETSHLR